MDYKHLKPSDFLPKFLSDYTRKIDGTITEIAENLLAKEVQFLCGAGFSFPSGCPLFSQLSKEMIKRLLGKSPTDPVDDEILDRLSENFPPEAIAECFLEEKDRPSLQKVLERSLINVEPKPMPHGGHKALSYFASQRLIDRVYTTNFDNLLKDEFSTRGFEIKDDNLFKLPTLEPSLTKIIYLHGKADGKFLITETETYKLDTPLAYVFKADLAQYRFIFLGYSMNDIDIKSIVFSTRDILKSFEGQKKFFYVAPLGEKATLEDWKISSRMWVVRGGAHIPMKAEDFMECLRNRLQWVRIEHYVKLIADAQVESTDKVKENVAGYCKLNGFDDLFKGIEAYMREEDIEFS